MPFSPGQFLSNINAHDGLARPNRFEVVIPIPKAIGSMNSGFGTLVDAIRDPVGTFKNIGIKDITSVFKGDSGLKDIKDNLDRSNTTRWLGFQCEQAELPGRSLLTIDQKIYGPTFKIPYQTQYNDITLNFLATNEFFERKLFEMWINGIMPTDSTNNLRFPKGSGYSNYDQGYLTNITIIQYDDTIKRIYSVKLIDAFPLSVAPMGLSWGEEGFHRVSVNFAYTRYEIVYDGAYNLEDAASAIFGTVGQKLFSKVSRTVSNTVANPVNKILGSSIGGSLGRLIF